MSSNELMYINWQELIKPDKIQVTGSKVTWQGKPVIVAAEIKKGNQVFPFRRPDGTPYWRQRRSH